MHGLHGRSVDPGHESRRAQVYRHADQWHQGQADGQRAVCWHHVQEERNGPGQLAVHAPAQRGSKHCVQEDDVLHCRARPRPRQDGHRAHGVLRRRVHARAHAQGAHLGSQRDAGPMGRFRGRLDSRPPEQGAGNEQAQGCDARRAQAQGRCDPLARLRRARLRDVLPALPEAPPDPDGARHAMGKPVGPHRRLRWTGRDGCAAPTIRPSDRRGVRLARPLGRHDRR